MNAKYDPSQPSLFAPLSARTATPSTSPRSFLPDRFSVPVYGVRLVRERDHRTEQITTPEAAARIACEILADRDREHFLVIALSTSGRVIGAHVAHVGTLDASIASAREVYRFAILVNAKSIIVAHNHPSGSLEPSRADRDVTQQLASAGRTIGITLHDHFIVGHDGDYTSLAQRGLM